MTSTKLTTLLLALLPALPAQQDRFGNPACDAPGQELADRSFFVLCHSATLKVPLWVGYELTPAQLQRRAIRPSHFRHDSELAAPGASDADYKYSGFSRGHMAPAADFAWSDQSIRATFLLSNAVPQLQRVNAGAWSRLEAAVRRIAAQSDAAYIFTGPLFDSEITEVIGANHVAVPSHTYKVILAVQGDHLTMYAAIVPNSGRCHRPT
jgi:endonuclease G, mitochondrial